MTVLIDAGNTRIKLDWLKEGSGHRAGNLLAAGLDDKDAIRRWLSELPQPPSSAIGVNVAGPNTAALVQEALGCPVKWFASAPDSFGVRNGYREPGQLGADRWAAMLGLAWHEQQRRAGQPLDAAAALLATFGTATTIDTLRPLDEQHASAERWQRFEFPGGLIFPGPEMMTAALTTGTANLPHAYGDIALFPTHTHQAIATGVAAAQAGGLLRQWLAGIELCGAPPVVYVSGGGWPLVSDEVDRMLADARRRLHLPLQPVQWLEAPVLDGLARLAVLTSQAY